MIMFTGIVAATGTLRSKEPLEGDYRMRFDVPPRLMQGCTDGDSICVSGACLTMLSPDETGFSADLSVETLEKTRLGQLEPGDAVNLELALRVSDRLGGHLVTGHVDGFATLKSRQPDGRSERFEFETGSGLARYVAPKGSVCLDGVSLTVNEVNGAAFSVCIIPHTLEVTTLGRLAAGDRVNVEIDLLARYLERLSTYGAENGPE
jgi:riboflavin synthase